MALYLYSQDTPAALAAQLSADRGEIAHVECVDASEVHAYAVDLLALLADAERTQADEYAPVEVRGRLGGIPVRVKLAPT